MSPTKGQISLEFMAYVGLLLLIFSVFGPIYMQQTIQIGNQRENIKAERVASVMEKEINTAIRFGSGYSRNFTVPREIGGSNYTVGLYPDERVLMVEWEDKIKRKQLLGNRFQGSPDPGENRISNVNGSIVFE